MNKDPDDILIRDMFEAVQTPYYDVSRKVLNRIHTAPQKKIFLGKMMVAVATLCAIIAFFGTIKLIRNQFPSPDIEQYAPINNQLISGEGALNGGVPEEETESRPEFIILSVVSKGNDCLSTIFPTLN